MQKIKGKKFNFVLPADMEEKIIKIARVKKKKKTQVVRDLIQDGLDNYVVRNQLKLFN